MAAMLLGGNKGSLEGMLGRIDGNTAEFACALRIFDSSSAALSAALVRSMRFMELTLGGCSQTAVFLIIYSVKFVWDIPSLINLSRISHAKIVGLSRLYCSILATTC